MGDAASIARANKLGKKLEFIIIVILTICYVSQGAKNSISTVGLILILLSLWIPVIITNVLFKKNPSSKIIKHVIGMGYGLFYLIVCIISDQQLVYTYAIPMLIVVAIYCDYLFSMNVGIAVMIIATVHSIVFTSKAGWTPQAIAAMEIEIASSYLVAIYALVSNKFIIGINNENMQKIEENKEKSDSLLANIMEISATIADDVAAVSDQMQTLRISSEETLTAMSEVQDGTSDTADSVQSQLLKTEEIQNQINLVTDASNVIGESVADSENAIQKGRANIENLIKQAEVSQEAGNSAVEEVDVLKNYTSQMESIVSLIKNVASQTSLLALNASIEAARAGEAGRGFAVVASEISNLAAQTQTATENISQLISNVTTEMDQVAGAISSLVENNKIQNESAKVTAQSFEEIAGSASVISTNAGNLNMIVGNLDSANKEIVESIQTISAITEEVSAHSTTTYSKSEQNKEIVSQVQEIVADMTLNADRLNQIQ